MSVDINYAEFGKCLGPIKFFAVRCKGGVQKYFNDTNNELRKRPESFAAQMSRTARTYSYRRALINLLNKQV